MNTTKLINSVLSNSQVNKLNMFLEWYDTYLERSWDMADKFLKVSFLIKILPKYKEPSIPKGKLFRIIPFNKKYKLNDNFTYKPKDYVSSWTTISTVQGWKKLADQIGIDIDNFMVLTTTQSYIPILSLKIKDELKKFKNLSGLDKTYYDNIITNKDYQKEVILDMKKGINAKIHYIKG